MLPLRLFADRTFAAANAATFLMYVGFFGAVFLITQYWQYAHGYSPLGAGLRVLPWTVMPFVIAPIAAGVASKIGERPLLIAGLGLMAVGILWLGHVATPTAPYTSMLPALIIGGFGSALFWAPAASIVFSSVSTEDEGIASGANNSIRELGGVFGVAILTTIFSSQGSFASPEAFADGMRPALLRRRHAHRARARSQRSRCRAASDSPPRSSRRSLPRAADDSSAGRYCPADESFCQRPKTVPSVSLQRLNQPMAGTGALSSAWPPSSRTFASVASMSSVSK